MGTQRPIVFIHDPDWIEIKPQGPGQGIDPTTVLKVRGLRIGV